MNVSAVIIDTFRGRGKAPGVFRNGEGCGKVDGGGGGGGERCTNGNTSVLADKYVEP